MASRASPFVARSPSCEREGFVSRRRGAGTFVTGDFGAKPIIADISDVLANLVAMGRETGVRLLEFAYRESPRGGRAGAAAEARRAHAVFGSRSPHRRPARSPIW